MPMTYFVSGTKRIWVPNDKIFFVCLPNLLYSYFDILLTCCLSSKLVTIKHVIIIFASPCQQDVLYQHCNINMVIQVSLNP